MKILIITGRFFGVIIFFFTSCLQKSVEEKFHANINDAIKYEKINEYDKALSKLDKAISLDSSKSFAFVFRGRMKSALNENKPAILDFSKAIILNSKNTSAYFYKAVSYAVIGNQDSAIANFDSAIQTKKNGQIIWDYNYNEFTDLEDQVDIEMSVILYNRGIFLYEKKRDSAAMADFYYSLYHGYKVDECNTYIGIILLSQAKETEGCAMLKKAVLNGDKVAIDFFSRYCEQRATSSD